MIRYKSSLEGVKVEGIKGFFVGWPNPPSEEVHIKLLENSAHIWLAIEEESHRVVGFINAISDQTLSAYIPLLEVLPEYQGQGIGGQLVEHMIETLKDYYMIDLLCDKEVVPFYKQFKMFEAGGMVIRNYSKQSGISIE